MYRSPFQEARHLKSNGLLSLTAPSTGVPIATVSRDKTKIARISDRFVINNCFNPNLCHLSPFRLESHPIHQNHQLIPQTGHHFFMEMYTRWVELLLMDSLFVQPRKAPLSRRQKTSQSVRR